MKRASDVSDIVFGGAEYDFRLVTARQTPQRAQEFVSIHLRHVPIEQDGVGKAALAGIKRLFSVFRFGDLEIEPLENTSSDLADDTGVIDNQAPLHNFHSTLGGPARFDIPPRS